MLYIPVVDVCVLGVRSWLIHRQSSDFGGLLDDEDRQIRHSNLQ